MCGKDTGSCPRHDITLPLSLLRITDLGSQKRLSDSMAKVMGSHEGKGIRKAAATTPSWVAGFLWLVLVY
jgi:hypothetical protein